MDDSKTKLGGVLAFFLLAIAVLGILDDPMDYHEGNYIVGVSK